MVAIGTEYIPGLGSIEYVIDSACVYRAPLLPWWSNADNAHYVK